MLPGHVLILRQEVLLCRAAFSAFPAHPVFVLGVALTQELCAGSLSQASFPNDQVKVSVSVMERTSRDFQMDNLMKFFLFFCLLITGWVVLYNKGFKKLLI